nr:LacI family DNA-binding transcriptional regulator [Opitutaceae bacterium]
MPGNEGARTLSDIARRAGVSKMTVSLALRG